jgi:myosin heavy subunit
MNEIETTPESVLDRQAQTIQFRVQQHLSLYDEEIERLVAILNSLKTKILESKQALHEIDRQILEIHESKSAEMRRKEVTVHTSLAKVKARHHHSLQQLQTIQTAEIEIEQAQFESEMERINDSKNAKLAESISELDTELIKHRKQLETYQESAFQIREHEETVLSDMEDHVETVDSTVIDELQQIVQQRNTERYQNLQQSKEKLSQCIETLDDMTRVHTLAVNDRRIALKEIEQKYETELLNLEERHRVTNVRLNGTLYDVQQRTKILLKAAHHLERSNQKQLNETMKELELMKNRTIARTDRPLLRPEDVVKVQKQKKVLEKLSKGRAGKDDNLIQIRGTNHDLKSEIWRMRHELRFSGGIRS